MNALRVAVPLVSFCGRNRDTGLLVAGDSGANAGGTEASAAKVRNNFSNATLNDRYAFRGTVPFAISGFHLAQAEH